MNLLINGHLIGEERERVVTKNFSTVKDVNVISEIRPSIPLWPRREEREKGDLQLQPERRTLPYMTLTQYKIDS